MLKVFCATLEPASLSLSIAYMTIVLLVDSPGARLSRCESREGGALLRREVTFSDETKLRIKHRARLSFLYFVLIFSRLEPYLESVLAFSGGTPLHLIFIRYGVYVSISISVISCG